MLALVEPEERRFTTTTELRDALAAQDRRLMEVPLGQLSLNRAGRLQIGGGEGRLAEAGLLGLLRTLGIPEGFARQTCPEDLLVTIVNRLAHARDRLVLVRLVDGVVTGVMPAQRQPIGHEMIVDWLGVTRPIVEATVVGEQVRIVAVVGPWRNLLPNDAFGFGWELISGEDGWHATELWRLTIRQACCNGMAGFDGRPAFRRAGNSPQPALKALADLRLTLDSLGEPPELEPAVRWAVEKHVGTDYEAVSRYLAQRLEGDATRVALGEIGADNSWYDLMNKVTSLAQLHRFEMRRRYEVEGGMLLHWFSSRGRTRPLWRRGPYARCEAAPTGADAGAHRAGQITPTGEPTLFD